MDKLKLDEPPYSRLFVICSKTATEDELRSAFEKYGTIEQIFIVKDTVTKEPKGVCYIKFAKTSEAARALEEMNGQCIATHSKPLHIRIAQSREQGSKGEINEEETLLRLFCVVPKTTTEQELSDHFQQFGELDYVSVLRDRETKASKGVAYVKFNKFLDAAKAVEECDRSYKAVFAKPKSQKNPLETFEPFSVAPPTMGYGTTFNPFSTNGSGVMNRDGFRTLRIIAPPSVTQNQLWRLFDLVPGLNFLKIDSKSRPGHGMAMYNNPEAAAYALKKLQGFEYPPGQRIIVKPELDRTTGGMPMPQLSRGSLLGMDPYVTASTPRLPLSADLPVAATAHSVALNPDLTVLAQTIAQAKSLLQSGGIGQRSELSSLVKMDTPDSFVDTKMSSMEPSGSSSGFQRDLGALLEKIGQATSIIQGLTQGTSRDANTASYCSVTLPMPQPLAPPNSETAERLFIVCNPQPLPGYVLKDIFGRFGNLIDVHMLSGKNYGYVKYATKESAEQALQTLHGQDVCGICIKLKTADPPTDTSRKRFRTTDD